MSMPQEAIRTRAREPPSGSSPTQGSESDLDITQGDDESSVLNLFVSVTNSESTGNRFSLRVNSFRRSNGRTPHQNSKSCRHGISEPHRCSDSEEDESIVDVPLSQLLKEECNELKDLTDAWVTTYESSQFEALRQMLELLLHSTGVLLPLTREQALKLNELTPETYNAWMGGRQNAETPLILEDMFLGNILTFLKSTLSGDVCTDILIMKRIFCLLDVFVNSTWVSSRYTALMISSFITDQCSTFWAELDSDLHDVLVTGNESSLQEKMAVVKNFFEEFIEIVFLCQRDYVLTVRKLACQIYCSWCQKQMQMLMTDQYLRYVYWSMYDESPSIRSLSIVTIASLYKSEYVVKNMKTFVEKTLCAIVERAQDENNRVAMVALETVKEIARRDPWLLKDVSLEHIFILIFGDIGSKATKAAELIHCMFDDMSTSNMQFIYNTLVFTEESMDELGEDVDVESAIAVMVENLFGHCRLELTDWSAWRNLLLGPSLDHSQRLQRLACLLLIEIIDRVSILAEDRYFVETEFPPAPSTDEKKRKGSIQKDERLKSECLDLLVRLTSALGPKLTLLWEKYKTNHQCVTQLVKIPQYFNGSIDFLDVKMIGCYLVYLKNRVGTSPSLEAIHRSMACIYHLMSASSKWTQQIPKFEHVLFNSVTKKFLKACGRLGKQPIPNHLRIICLKIIKDCFYLTKFFDVTKTCLLDDTLIALRYGVEKKNAEVVCPTMMMCLYILEWQLKLVVEGGLAEDERAAVLYKMQSQSRTLHIKLVNLITVQTSLVRETAYSVLCRLFTTFCRLNVFASPYHLLHLPCPTLETNEWLNYCMTSLVPRDHIPEDEHKYEMACVALQQFCSLMEFQVLSLAYLSSILHLFQFYNLPKNYNDVLLKSFEGMAKMTPENMDFPHSLIESLIWMRSNTDFNVEEMTKGVCAVLLRGLRPAKRGELIAVEVIGYGLTQVKNPTQYGVFRLLAVFATLLESKYAKNFYKKVLDTFHLYTEKEDVKVFLAALGLRMRKDQDQLYPGGDVLECQLRAEVEQDISKEDTINS